MSTPSRRGFLWLSALGVAATQAAPSALARQPGAGPPPPIASLGRGTSWAEVQRMFDLDPDKAHLAGLLHASHPRPVQAAIARYRRALDADPVTYLMNNMRRHERETRAAAARFLNARPDEIALTFNTTTGVGLMYAGLSIRSGQELLTTVHGYHVTHDAIEMRAARTGASVRKVRLYDHGARADADEMVQRLISQIRDETRVLALTWVHSSTGVKIPLQRIGQEVARINRGRSARDRILICVDGVHGLGVEPIDVRALGVDFLAAGTHKWLNGPRGTGVLFGASRSHGAVSPVMATFTRDAGWGGRMSPGGFHAWDHRWAVQEAFAMQQSLGPDRIAGRIHGLAGELKRGLGELRGVSLQTPRSASVSSGIVCFTVSGRTPRQVIRQLRAQGVIGSTTPYSPSYARLTPGLMNDERDIARAVNALRGFV